MAYKGTIKTILERRLQKYFGKLTSNAFIPPVDLLNNDPLNAQNAANTAQVALIKLDSSNVTQLPNGASIPTAKTLVVADADGLTVGGKILPQTFTVPFVVPAGAAAADYDGVLSIRFACKLVTAVERHQTAGNDAGAVTLMVKKVPSGTARAAGTDCLSAGISLKATADTNQSGALHATPANYTFAAGDGVALVTTGTLTAVDGVGVMLDFQRV